MKKTTNNNTKQKKDNEKQKWYGDYYCVFGFQKKSVTAGILDRYAQELREWVDDPTQEPFKLSEWYLKKGMPSASFYEWSKKHEAFGAAHKYAIERLGNIREKKATIGSEYDPGMIKLTLGHYCPIFKQEQERTAALKSAAEQEGSGKIVVEMHAFGSSDIVPVKKDKK